MKTETGIIKRVEETQVISDKFKKRVVVITIPDGDYSQDVGFEFTQDNVGKLDQYKEGEKVEISYNIKGNDWQNPKDGSMRNFVTLNGWKIGYTDEHADAIQGELTAKQLGDDTEESDLPF